MPLWLDVTLEKCMINSKMFYLWTVLWYYFCIIFWSVRYALIKGTYSNVNTITRGEELYLTTQIKSKIASLKYAH